jgi:hypothetical protein
MYGLITRVVLGSLDLPKVSTKAAILISVGLIVLFALWITGLRCLDGEIELCRPFVS